MNTVIRQCSKCNYRDKDCAFEYLRDGVWACPHCGSKYTFIAEVFEEAAEELKEQG